MPKTSPRTSLSSHSGVELKMFSSVHRNHSVWNGTMACMIGKGKTILLRIIKELAPRVCVITDRELVMIIIEKHWEDCPIIFCLCTRLNEWTMMGKWLLCPVPSDNTPRPSWLWSYCYTSNLFSPRINISSVHTLECHKKKRHGLHTSFLCDYNQFYSTSFPCWTDDLFQELEE